jgi:hypothetical protein
LQRFGTKFGNYIIPNGERVVLEPPASTARV